MALDAFVRKHFGKQHATKLANIRRGGDNNSKGSSFESYYAAAKVCEIAAKHEDLDNYVISSQEMAFVDDLCVRSSIDNHKDNFQAKNSSGAAASWDAEMEERFRMQIEIDAKFHNAHSSRQVLLVSCPDMQASNDEKIPEDLKKYCFSEFFPYRAQSTQVIYASTCLRDNLKAIIKDPDDLQAIDTAFRVVISAWVSDDKARSVGDILGQAKALCKPNLFRDEVPERPGIPSWLHELCMTFPKLDARVEFGTFKVSYNGFEVNLGSNPDQPDTKVLKGLSSVGEAFNLLAKQIHKELN